MFFLNKLLSANYSNLNTKEANIINECKDLYYHEKITNALIENENVEFCYEVSILLSTLFYSKEYFPKYNITNIGIRTIKEIYSHYDSSNRK